MSTTAAQMREWTGLALFTYGFRPFFLGAALWSGIAMLLWIPLISGHITLPTAFDPVSWHAHEFLFGYVTAVIAGFLLTAVPNWTGRLPIVGWPLACLFAVWVVGRVAIVFSANVPPLVTVAIDLAMPVALAILIAREIVAGKNWRNLLVLGMLTALIVGNAVFHWEAAQGYYAAQGYGLRIGLAATLMMIAVIGGRVVPSFTRNWLVKNNPSKLPTPPMQGFDQVALLALLVALLLWIGRPEEAFTAAVLGLAGVLHVVRLLRWQGLRTLSEPLISVLHGAYLLLPLGALALAFQIAVPTWAGLGAVQHLWMGGGITLMTLAIMTRATLGHTGRALTAGRGTVFIYLAVLAAALLRVSVGLWPAYASSFYSVAALFWIAGFFGFAILYGPLLLRARPAKKA